MKAHIRRLPKVALAWGLAADSEAFATLSRLLQEQNIPLREVGSSQAGSTVGYLCGIPGASEVSLLLMLSPDAYPPALVLCGLEEAELDALLTALHTEKLKIPLKAVVTRHNEAWPFCHLLEELQKEQAALEGPQGETPAD